MDLALKVAKFAAFSCLAFFLVTLSVVVGDVRNTLRAVERDIQGVTDKAGVELITLNASTNQISNQAAATLKQVGATATQVKTTVASLKPSVDELHSVLQEGYHVALDARLSLDNVNKAAIDERTYFEKDLPPLMDAIKTDVIDAGDTITSAKTLIADPNLKRILKSSANITESGGHMLSTADAVETKATNSYLHPSTNPVARAWQEIKPFIVPAAQVGAAIALH